MSEPPMTKPSAPQSYVCEVPEHCDRITWRGRYYHLDAARSLIALDRASPQVPPRFVAAAKQLRAQFGSASTRGCCIEFDEALAALDAASPRAANGERAWLVELQSDGQCRGWIQADDQEGFGWTLDPNKAIRFCRKIDADWFRQRYGFTCDYDSTRHLSTHHAWFPPDSPRAAGADEQAIDWRKVFYALVDAIKTHKGDTGGFEFGLGRVRFENGKPVEFYWATTDDVDAAIDAVLSQSRAPTEGAE